MLKLQILTRAGAIHGLRPRPRWLPEVKLHPCRNGISMVYSWKRKSASPSSKPDIQIGFEPIRQHSGTASDPLTQPSTKEILHSFKIRMPLDLDWTNHLLSICFDSETKY
ncbi:hypothetical protein BJX63DRAFT_387682 [Aspergillus granulosus]|uniref:Uncharacterized protein n=1 Tax=Aspergillus granulosus TaxID=176169 RepID=A0ABR4HN23_9EURO